MSREKAAGGGVSRVARNAMASVGQTVVSALLLFVLYRAVLQSLGAEALGVWSVVLATTGAARIAELGLSGSAVKYVAAYAARGEASRAARAAETTVVSVAAGAALAAALAYLALRPLVPVFIPEVGVDDALRLLPYACVSLWLSSVAMAAHSGLDGYHRYDIRNGIQLLGQALYVGLALALLRPFGLVGLAVAQIVQGAATLTMGWWALRRIAPDASVVPWRWDRSLFREMLGYGAQFQALAVLRMTYEPVTKACLSAFGGLALAGFFEMASQFVLKLRAVLVSAQQVLTPEVAARHEQRPGEVDAIYYAVDRTNWALSLVLFGTAAAVAPLLSHLWIGAYTPAFVVFTGLLVVGWFANALTGPAFFLLLGVGSLGPLLSSHTTIAVVNLSAGAGLGALMGGAGVVAGWTLALVLGAVHLLIRVQTVRGIPLRVPEGIGALASASVAGAVASLAWTASTPGSLTVAALSAAAFGVLVAGPLWRTGVPTHVLRIARGQTDAPTAQASQAEAEGRIEG